MSNVAIDLTKTVKEIIETMKTAIDNLNTNVDSLKSEVLLAAHPVGSYYISDNATSPASLFGGTWQMLDPGLTLISQGKGTDKFGSFEFVAGQTYGERMHQLTVDELAKHSHGQNASVGSNGGYVAMVAGFPSYNEEHPIYKGASVWIDPDGHSSSDYSQIKTDDSGAGQPHNNVAPAKACYVWRRTA